jgi:crotonobetaine/carnitine-CoA ligase
VPEASIGPGDTVAILYTSGTTGVSKGVCCPHAQYFWWGVNTARLLGVREDDVLLTTLPLFHTNALNTFYQALLTGAAMVVEPRFSASGFAASLSGHGATVTYLLGAMVPILLSRPADEFDRAHRVRIALAPGVPERFHPEFRARFGFELLDGYGSTETNFVLGCALSDQRPGAMGPVFEGFEGRAVDDADNTLPDGVPGELVLRADEPFAFATGYFGMPDKTVEAWRNLWFHTGDRVVRDAAGYFRFIDRMKDAIRRRGENISSYEVEQVLLSHPDVAEAAAFPVQSELAEDEVMVAIVPRDGQALTPAALAEYCEGRMPAFAIPRFIEFLTALPMTENGKVQKFRLRERGVTAATWDRGTGRR